MRVHRDLKCPHCEVPLVDHGVSDFQTGIPMLMRFESFRIWSCPDCGKVEFFLLPSSLHPAPYRSDRQTWTCTCGVVNPSEEIVCSNCHDPRTYEIG